MIIRRRHNGRYTILGNHIAEDDRLSFEAVGLLAYLLSRPDDWRVHTSQLCQRGSIGRDKCQRLLRELIEAGYVVRQRARSDDGRRLAGLEYVVYDEPLGGAGDGGAGGGHEGADTAKTDLEAGRETGPENARQEAGKSPAAPQCQGPEIQALEGGQEPDSQGPENPALYKVRKDNNSDPSDRDAGPPKAAPVRGGGIWKKVLFGDLLPRLATLTGQGEGQVRKLIGKWLSEAGDDARRVCEAIEAALEDPPAHAASWISARLVRPGRTAADRPGYLELKRRDEEKAARSLGSAQDRAVKTETNQEARP